MDHLNTCQDVESLWIDIFPDIGLNNKIRVGAFYRPPSQSRQTDMAMIDEIERGMSKNTILLGDFNLPKLFKDGASNTPETALFRDSFDELFLTQHVMKPTRNDEILDLILTNNENLIDDVLVGEHIGNSDHAIIRFSIKCHIKRSSSRYNCTPNFSRGDYDVIRSFLGHIDWTEMFERKNVHEMWNVFKQMLAEAQYRFIPQRRRQVGKALKPIWFNCEVQKKFQEKKNAFYDFKTTPSTEHRANYVKARKSLKKTIRGAKRSSEIKLSNECGGDLKRFLDFINLTNIMQE